MYVNDTLELIKFFSQLSNEIQVKIIICLQIILIIAEIICFFYIKKITNE